MVEALCWACSVKPSQIAKFLWSNTHEDIKCILKVKVGFEQTLILQNYASFSLLLKHAFGDKSNNQVKAPSNIAEAKKQFAGLFTNGG